MNEHPPECMCDECLDEALGQALEKHNLETSLENKQPLRCECGSSAIGSPFHSYYCPLAAAKEKR